MVGRTKWGPGPPFGEGETIEDNHVDKMPPRGRKVLRLRVVCPLCPAFLAVGFHRGTNTKNPFPFLFVVGGRPYTSRILKPPPHTSQNTSAVLLRARLVDHL